MQGFKDMGHDFPVCPVVSALHLERNWLLLVGEIRSWDACRVSCAWLGHGSSGMECPELQLLGSAMEM